MKKIILVVAVSLLSLSGCLVEGGSCSGGGAACVTKEDSLWCETSTLVPYRCPGELGCSTSDNGNVACDFRGSAEGQPCPKAAAGVGFCATSTRFISCVNQKWSGMACSSCTTSGLIARCTP